MAGYLDQMVGNGRRANRYNARRIFGSAVVNSFILILLASCFSIQIRAQDDPEDDALPPPLRVISKEEKSRLDVEREVKSRTKLALELMEGRLATAEKELSSSDYEAMMGSLGGFEGLLDNHLDFLTRADNDSNRVLDNFKRFEIGLRKFVPRIETIRRELPFRFEQLVRKVGKYLRDARTRALEPLFSDTVVRQPRKPN